MKHTLYNAFWISGCVLTAIVLIVMLIEAWGFIKIKFKGPPK